MRSNHDWLRELAVEGPEQEFALAALRRHLLRVLPGCLKRHCDIPPDLLEDVVQDTLLRALAQLSSFEGRSRFTTWVTTIAVRVALTEVRRKRWQDVSLETLTRGAEVDAAVHAEAAANPERSAARQAILRALQDALATRLSERQRTAIVAELRGMPQEEIGRRLGISRNAVYKLGHDARKKLKLGLEASGFDAAEIDAAFS